MKNILCRQDKAFALPLVMFYSAILFTSAAAFAWFAKAQTARVSAEKFIFQSRCAAEAACEAALQKINEDANGYDSTTETLYSPNGGLFFEMGGCRVKVKISPMNDKISTQGLFLPDGRTLRSEYEQAWRNIWREVGHPELEQLSLDFMDKDTKQRMGSYESREFINRPLFDLSELKLLKGVTKELIYGGKNNKKSLNLFISASGSDKININTAKAETFIVLDSDISLDTARSIVYVQNIRPFMKTSELKDFPGFPISAYARLSNVLSTESAQFELRINVAENNLERNYTAIVQRGETDCILRWEE